MADSGDSRGVTVRMSVRSCRRVVCQDARRMLLGSVSVGDFVGDGVVDGVGDVAVAVQDVMSFCCCSRVGSLLVRKRNACLVEAVGGKQGGWC